MSSAPAAYQYRRGVVASCSLLHASGEPAISVDTKKKELAGDFKNAGRKLRPKGEPEKVRIHDFVIPELGKAAPYGVYDIANNEAWVSVGTDPDTAAFAAASIKAWWDTMGKAAYPSACFSEPKHGTDTVFASETSG